MTIIGSIQHSLFLLNQSRTFPFWNRNTIVSARELTYSFICNNIKKPVNEYLFMFRRFKVLKCWRRICFSFVTNYRSMYFLAVVAISHLRIVAVSSLATGEEWIGPRDWRPLWRPGTPRPRRPSQRAASETPRRRRRTRTGAGSADPDAGQADAEGLLRDEDRPAAPRQGHQRSGHCHFGTAGIRLIRHSNHLSRASDQSDIIESTGKMIFSRRNSVEINTSSFHKSIFCSIQTNLHPETTLSNESFQRKSSFNHICIAIIG